MINSIKLSNKYIDEVGIEIPAIPGKKNEVMNILEKIEKNIDFLNLNEFEYADRSLDEFKRRGFLTKEKNRQSIEGSEELANFLLQKEFDFTTHFCPSHFKDSIQLRRRFIRRANEVKEEYEEVTEDGTLVKGIIETNNLSDVVEKLKKEEVPNKLFKEKEDVVEIAWWVLDDLVGDLEKLSNNTYIVEQHPTEYKLVVQRIPLSHKK